MRTFRCPGCGKEQKALAVSVGHRCPAKSKLPRNRQWVEFDYVPAGVLEGVPQ